MCLSLKQSGQKNWKFKLNLNVKKFMMHMIDKGYVLGFKYINFDPIKKLHHVLEFLPLYSIFLVH
jgi:hypothetical protein